jgi:hypothetical protein
MECRTDCGACYRPFDFKSYPRYAGKPANTRCVQLADDNTCKIFGSPLRPAVCASLQPSAGMCFSDREAAMTFLINLEAATAP